MGYNIHSSHIKIHGNKCELISRIQNTHYMFTLHSSKSTMCTYMYMEMCKTLKNVQKVFKFVYTTFFSMVICLPMPLQLCMCVCVCVCM